MIEDYSIETVLVEGNPIQSFTHRFKSLPALFSKSVETYGDSIGSDQPNRLDYILIL